LEFTVNRSTFSVSFSDIHTMKPNYPSLKGNFRTKHLLAFVAVAIVLFAGIGINFMIESKVLDSVKAHTAQNDSVMQHSKYQQLVEKTMFLITQSDNKLETFILSGDTADLTLFTTTVNAINANLAAVKTGHVGYVPKYLVNIFIHKASNHVAFNKEALLQYSIEGKERAMAMLNSPENKASLKAIAYSSQELVQALGTKIAQLNTVLTAEKTEMLQLDQQWNLISFVFMLLIALLVLYKMIETNRLNENLSIAVKKEQQANLVKDQFISNVTHELRTPLNSIIGYTNLLLKKEHSVETTPWIHAMKVSGNLLMEVINDVLDYSKLESGYIQFASEPMQVQPVLQNLQNVLRNRAEAKNLLLVVDKDDKIPKQLLGDEKKLMQILVNLTGNAIKFTEEGTVQIEARLVKQNADGKVWIQFVITDTGIGIEPDKLPHVFERFYQVESGSSKKYFGTGLGLPIVKQLVEMQGGAISVSSVHGEGTTFEIVLPFAVNTASEVEAPLQAMVEERNEPALAPKKILIVDDNEMNRDLMGYLLHGNHFLYEKAENGSIALQMLRENRYDFVLMDIQMPGISGIETTKKIRAELQLQTPVIGLSAFCQPEEQQAAINAGMNAYLTKPVDEVKLFELLDHYHDWDTQPAQEHSTQLKLVNIEYLQRLTGGKKENIEDLLGKAFDFLPGEVKKLQESFAAENPALLREVAHNMKSTLRILGVAEDISVKVVQIEKADLSKSVEKEQIRHLIEEIDHSVQIVLRELREYLAAA
jgi:signal transduction histidine kinase/response regulator RpfG family c-di-GMP phosphodiesterase